MTSGNSNVDSIRASDEEIRKQEEVTINLKRSRNSLLAVSKLPPELLGDIFHRNVMLEGEFGGLEKRSHNFLLVCHRWFKVALSTPQVWSFWGNTTKEWAKCYHRSETAPLDLVLRGPLYSDECFDQALFDALRNRANRNTLRRVHLESRDPPLLQSVLSSLTPQVEEVLSIPMESFILRNWDLNPPVDVSDFFARHRFPKLERLKLTDCTISSWDYLISRTGALTELCLDSTGSSTSAQLLSILASNPLLQRVTLSPTPIPDNEDDVSHRVPLHHLRYLELTGDLRSVFELLHRLDHPLMLDELAITLCRCTVTELSQIIGPFIRDHFQRRGRSQSGLGLEVSSTDRIVLRVGNLAGISPESAGMNKIVALTIRPDQVLLGDVQDEAVRELVSCIPREEFVSFRALDETMAMGDMYSRLPNLRTLHLTGLYLPTAFPDLSSGGDEDEGILLYLQNLTLEWPTTKNSDWSPLTDFLAGRASFGKQLDILEILHSGHMCSEVVKGIEGVVRRFDATKDLLESRCPLNICAYRSSTSTDV